MLAILVAINWISNRQNWRKDFTAGGTFTLADQTRKILETLPNPINVKVFAKGDDFDRFRDRLDQFQYASKKVNVEYVDIYKRPALADQYQDSAGRHGGVRVPARASSARRPTPNRT